VGERGRLNFQTRGVILPTLAETPTYERGERVNSHGEIIMPYLGTVHVEGLTPAEVEATIAARLRQADLLRKPQVSVDVVEYRHGVVAVMGSVQRPGLYPITRPGTTLADQIWAAGGPEKEAGRVVAFTPVNGTEPIRIDLERLIQPDGSADRELNPRVVPGDVISIAPAGNVLVDGWVDKPGSYPVTRGLTVTGAIAAAGGRLFAADPRKVTIKRTIGTSDQEVLQIDLVAVTEGRAPDFPLTDGDVVRMPSSWVRVVPWTVWQLAREVVNVGGNVLLF
jgi:polysaccharide export outer membrane protein